MKRFLNIIIGNAWPYANGELHLGRIAVLLPGDILARYHRLMGDDVVFVSGSDSHGTPVTMKAKEENLTPEQVSAKFHLIYLLRHIQNIIQKKLKNLYWNYMKKVIYMKRM